ncbi:hypothetical protein GGP89_003494 [Salinibacter ruber]|uniref:Uncharacterized protein n=1 Tax=Salinibacter ruber TaxID=146919 RepID=A0A9X2U511_9BACT|nr:hypothetical protein [Salinibacter ruber]MCS3860083.1 hypothetical protein [Salinibacter ruber]MCS3866911.1 hypothetical protein [Salinibacter ruber]
MKYDHRGRPKKGSEKLSENIAIKVPPFKKQQFKAFADRCGVSLSDFVRGGLFRFLFTSLEQEGLLDRETSEIDPGSHPELFPEDFADFIEAAEQIRDKVKETRSADALEGLLIEIRDFLKEKKSEYESRREKKENRKQQYDTEIGTKINVRVTPTQRSWLEEMHSRQGPDALVGLSSWIRSILSVYMRNYTRPERTIYSLNKWIGDVYEALREREKDKMRNQISNLSESFEEKIYNKKQSAIGSLSFASNIQ